MSIPRRTTAAAVSVLLCGAAAGCSGDAGSEGGDPQERLESARQVIDDAESIELSLETSDLPDGTEGIISADGVGTHDPAFEGDAQVRAFGITGEVPVVAIGGDVYVKMPFKKDFEPFDLEKYDAPDPAALLNPDDGVTSMVTALEGVEAGETELDGETEVTPVEGTLAGSQVSKLFPAVDDGDEFDVTFRLDDEDVLRDASITGPFYDDADDLTYTIELTASDDSVDISAPS